MEVNQNYKDLLRVFDRHQVRFLVVGGFAVMLYTEPYTTKDLDVWVEPVHENAVRVFSALAEFGAPLTNVPGATVSGAGLTAEDTVSMEGRTFQRFTASRVAAGEAFVVAGTHAWSGRAGRVALIAVAVIATFEGYDAPPTAEGVSRATTRTVVSSALTILALDLILTSLMFRGR